MCQVKLIDQSLVIAYDLIFQVQKQQFIGLIEGNYMKLLGFRVQN